MEDGNDGIDSSSGRNKGSFKITEEQTTGSLRAPLRPYQLSV
jgi:hypothetical protein